MTDLEHCLILGGEPIDSNSLNRCIFNLFSKMGEANSITINATSENVPQFPFFSGGYENALTGIPYVSSLGTTSATVTSTGVVQRLYNGNMDIVGLNDNNSFITESVTGAYKYSYDSMVNFAPTVESLFRDRKPLLFKSVLDSETSLASNTYTIGSNTSPTVKTTSYLLCEKIGVSFGTVTFRRSNGDTQKNEVTVNVKTDLIGIDGVERICFMTIGNGVASGVKTISENHDMVTDVGPCTITYGNGSNITISNITKNDNGDELIIDNETGRILDDEDEYDYNKCTKLKNDEYNLHFFIIFELKDSVLEYSDDLWCFNVASTSSEAVEKLGNSNLWAENYSKYTFSNFEKADCGYLGNGGSHNHWDGGCTITATDAFNGCSNATFESLNWISPRLRYCDRMFNGCSNATFISLPNAITLDNCRSAASMFANCRSTSFDTLTSVSLSSASRLEGMFSGCSNATFGEMRHMVLNGNAKNMFKDDYTATFAKLESIAGSATTFESMFEGCDNAEFNSRFATLSSHNTNHPINACRMFYGLTKSTFSELTGIDFKSTSGYDGTSMFEGCNNSTFDKLESLGNVKCAKRMFMNLDEAGEKEGKSNAIFDNLHTLGGLLTDGTEMFRNDTHAEIIINNEEHPNMTVEVGIHMFDNVRKIKIGDTLDANRVDLPNLIEGDYMFANAATAEVHGDMDSLIDGRYMFHNCDKVIMDGTMDSLANMDCMCLSSTDVDFREVPSTATNMQASFAGISGHCAIGEWNGVDDADSGKGRMCTQSFANSRNILINGNILDGNIRSTASMFENANGLIIRNTEMAHYSDDGKRYFNSVDSSGDYSFIENFDSEGRQSPTLTFIGSANDITKLASIATSSDVSDSMICIESIKDGSLCYYVYTVSTTPTAGVDDTKFLLSSLAVDGENPFGLHKPDTATIYKLTDEYTLGDEYGTLELGEDNSLKLKDLNDDVEMEIDNYGSSAIADGIITTIGGGYDEIETITRNWTNAEYMFHNVVEDSLLSGYDSFISEGLKNTSHMFELDEKVEGDTTFKNCGKLFKRMKHSSITDMSYMFHNRLVYDYANCFVDTYNSESINSHHRSLLIPHGIKDASYAFCNCTLSTASENIDYIRLKIPNSLKNASHMFDGYDGPPLKLENTRGNWIDFGDDVNSDMMFNGCKFYNDPSIGYRFSAQTIYQQIFNNSNFSLDNVEELSFSKNFAVPYSKDEFFYNDGNTLGCSSTSFRKLTTDITEWLNDGSTHIEGAYFATVFGPVNSADENYEIMSADNDGSDWKLRMADISGFTVDMMENMSNELNKVSMDSIGKMEETDSRATCMFAPTLLLTKSEITIGDRIADEMDLEDRELMNEKFASFRNTDYRNATFGNLKSVNLKEMPFAFFGLENATFSNLKSIGEDSVAAYGAFAECGKADFGKLKTIQFSQNDSENMFSSRFATSTEQMSSWYGNYNDMFHGDSSATFSNLKTICFNTRSGTLSGGEDAMMWLDERNGLTYSYETSSSTTSVAKTHTYCIKVLNNEGKFNIGLYSFPITLRTSLDTGIAYRENREIAYELSEIEDDVAVVTTIVDDNNVSHYYKIVADAENNRWEINEHYGHPSDCHVEKLDGFQWTRVMTPATGTPGAWGRIDTIALGGQLLTIKAGRNADGHYKFNLSNTKETILTLGTLIDCGNDGEKDTRTYFSVLPFEKDKKDYLMVTIFQTDAVLEEFIEYPKDRSKVTCYLISFEIGNDGAKKYSINESKVIPGTILHYNTVLRLEDKPSSVTTHKANCSGMFKNCGSATFEKLESIVIPMSGSCSEMFAGCESMHLSSGQLKNLILPKSSNYGADDDWRQYQRMFAGNPTSSLDFGRLTLDNTNIYELGHESDSSHKIIGERLFDGMIATDGRVFNIGGGDPCTYSDAMYYLNMDSDLANRLFDRRNVHTVMFYAVDQSTVVSRREVDADASESLKKVRFPIYDCKEVTCTGWKFYCWNEGGLSSLTPEPIPVEEREWGVVSQNLTAYPYYEPQSNRPFVMQYSGTESTSAFHVQYSDSEETSALYTS